MVPKVRASKAQETPTNGFICVIKLFSLPKGLSSILSFPAVEERELEDRAENTALVKSNKLQGVCFLFHYPTQQLLKWKVFCTSKHQGEGDGRKERNDEGEMKAILSLHCSFAFPITVADKRGKWLSNTSSLLHGQLKVFSSMGGLRTAWGRKSGCHLLTAGQVEAEASSAVQTGLYALKSLTCTESW